MVMRDGHWLMCGRVWWLSSNKGGGQACKRRGGVEAWLEAAAGLEGAAGVCGVGCGLFGGGWGGPLCGA